MDNKTYAEFPAGTPTSDRITLHADASTGTLEKATLQELFNQSYNIDSSFRILQRLGSPYIATALNLSPFLCNTTYNPQNQRPELFIFEVPQVPITGIVLGSRGAGNFTANNFNGAALYDDNGTQWVQSAITANDPTMWTAANGQAKAIAFTSPFTPSTPFILIGLFYNYSAQVSAPAYIGIANTPNAATLPASGLYTNIISFKLNTTTTPPASLSYTAPGVATGTIPFIALY